MYLPTGNRRLSQLQDNDTLIMTMIPGEHVDMNTGPKLIHRQTQFLVDVECHSPTDERKEPSVSRNSAAAVKIPDLTGVRDGICETAAVGALETQPSSDGPEEGGLDFERCTCTRDRDCNEGSEVAIAIAQPPPFRTAAEEMFSADLRKPMALQPDIPTAIDGQEDDAAIVRPPAELTLAEEDTAGLGEIPAPAVGTEAVTVASEDGVYSHEPKNALFIPVPRMKPVHAFASLNSGTCESLYHFLKDLKCTPDT